MSDEYLRKEVHDEFANRMDAENVRLSHRITAVEETLKKVSDITVELKELAVSVKQMADELKKQGDRLTAIEQKPAKRWDALITGILGAIAGAIGAGIVAGIIH